MRKFYRPIFDDSDRYPGFYVVDRELNGFDVTAFWMGQRWAGTLPPTVRLYVNKDAPPDYVANPISWPICSARMAAIVERRAGADVQFLDAPLYTDGTHDPVPGYRILNVVRRIVCLDLTKSAIGYRDNDPTQLASVDSPVVDRRQVLPNVHVFRSAEFFPLLFFSAELFQDLHDARVKGLAFLGCDAV